MKKVFNFRAIFLIFCGIFVGAFFSLDFLSSNVWVKVLVLSIIFISAVLAFLPIKWFKVHKIAMLLVVASVCLGFLLSYARIDNYNKTTINQNMSVNAVVTDKIKFTEKGYVAVVLRDAITGDKKLNGNIVIYVRNATLNSFSAGDRIEFEGYVRTRELYREDGNVNAGYDAMGQKYYAFLSYDKITLTEGKANIFERIRISGRQSILKACGDTEEANMLYSVLFGDKTYIDYDLTNSFSKAGVAHLLAVSGLHIGFIVAIVVWICSRFNARAWVKFLTVGLLLGIYMFICGFSVSVVRASIMSLVLLGSAMIGKQYDGLTSLGIAGLVILFVKPLYALDLGFQLSFGSVLGIMCLSDVIAKGLRKCRFPRSVADAMAVTLASYAGTLPFTLKAFGELSWIGVLSNILLVPLFGIIFSVSFVVMVLCLLMPFLSFLYVPIRWFTFGFIRLTLLFAWFKPLIVVGFGAFTIIYVVIMLCVSKFSFLSKTFKILGSVTLGVIFSISAIVPLIPQRFVANAIYTAGSSGFLLTTSKDNAVYITSSLSESEAEEVFDNLSSKRLKKWVSEIIILDKPSYFTKQFALDNPEINIYYFSSEVASLAGVSNVKCIHTYTVLPKSNIEVCAVKDNNEVAIVSTKLNGINIAFVDNLTSGQVSAVNDMFLRYDMWVFNEFESRVNTYDAKLLCASSDVKVENLNIAPQSFGLAMEFGRS